MKLLDTAFQILFLFSLMSLMIPAARGAAVGTLVGTPVYEVCRRDSSGDVFYTLQVSAWSKQHYQEDDDMEGSCSGQCHLARGADKTPREDVRQSDGRVFCYCEDGAMCDGNWTIVGDNGEMSGSSNDHFGRAVAMSSNGKLVAVGASRTNMYTGLVRVYSLNETANSWSQLGNDLDGAAEGDLFGYTVALSSDGLTMAVGASGRRNSRGSVYIYTFDDPANGGDGDWSLIGSAIDGQSASDWSGSAISLSSDGKTVAIGAHAHDDTDWDCEDSGQVRIFQLNETSMDWSQLGDDLSGEDSGDMLGQSLSLASDGYTVAVGAHYNDGAGARAGHARVFQFDVRDSTWTKLGADIDGKAEGDSFGWSVSLSSDGQTLAVGATENSDAYNHAGQARIFRWNGTSWTQLGEDLNGEGEYDHFGYSVSLSSDGKAVAVGSTQNNAKTGYMRGYTYNGTNWSLLGGGALEGASENDYFGLVVSLSSDGTTVVVGSRGGYARVHSICD